MQSNYLYLSFFFFLSIAPCNNELGKHKPDVGSRLRKSKMFSSFYLNTKNSFVGLYGILWVIIYIFYIPTLTSSQTSNYSNGPALQWHKLCISLILPSISTISAIKHPELFFFQQQSVSVGCIMLLKPAVSGACGGNVQGSGSPD